MKGRKISRKYRRKLKRRFGGIMAAMAAVATISFCAATSVSKRPGIVPETQENVSISPESVIKAEKNVIEDSKSVYFNPEIEFIPLDVPMSESDQRMVFDKCEEYGMSFTLIMALIAQESNFDNTARSNTGDSGLMQINDCNKENMAELGFVNLFDKEMNVEAGIYIMSQFIGKYEVNEALMAYNMGESGAARLWEQGIYETKYSREILAREAEFSEYVDKIIIARLEKGEIAN